MDDLMTNENIKKLHKIQIEILDEIVRICNKHNLTYFLVGGTLLGAVRHKGFIPWDDDLDIGMPREDYQKMLEIFPKELDKDYIIDNKETNPKYYLAFTKIRKKDTIFEEKTQINYDGPKGIWVDIFPFENVNNLKTKTIKYQRKFYYFLRSITLYKNKMYNDTKLKTIIGKICSISNRRLLTMQDKILRLQNNKENKGIINLTSSYDYEKELFVKEDFFPLNKLEFEGKKYFVPKKYDKILSKVYGDYMKLPPKDKRITHNPVKLVFKK